MRNEAGGVIHPLCVRKNLINVRMETNIVQFQIATAIRSLALFAGSVARVVITSTATNKKGIVRMAEKGIATRIVVK